jgi:hypothetical protein
MPILIILEGETMSVFYPKCQLGSNPKKARTQKHHIIKNMGF